MTSSWLTTLLHLLQGIQQAGWIGWLWFIGLYVLACLTFVPGSILTLGAGAIYGFWEGTALVLIANALGSLFSLLIARYFLHDWMKKKLEHHAKMRSIERAVKKEGWKIVLLTRLSPIMPFSLINYALGLTDISASSFFLATLLGALPSTCVYVFLGAWMGNLARIRFELRHHNPHQWMIQSVGLIATLVLTIYLTRLATRALRNREDHKEV